MFKKYKIMTKNDKKGVWLSELDFIDLLKLSKYRNKKIFNKIKGWWEHLNNEKLDEKEFLK